MEKGRQEWVGKLRLQTRLRGFVLRGTNQRGYGAGGGEKEIGKREGGTARGKKTDIEKRGGRGKPYSGNPEYG